MADQREESDKKSNQECIRERTRVIVALIMRQPLSADSPDLEIRCCIRSEDIVCEVRDSYKTLHLDLAMTTINGNVNDVH